ncbi:MAG: response regulator transcription factor [Spirochaetaceae bacterium]|nr:response regulator transcription factor [Spirochaetaceae bacterium]MCF7947369.1 response regulator transcription factor [Spirochaetia bacterium]MCF7950305.1 response regulator transcription factor [Spirochaetaceae bacterium]
MNILIADDSKLIRENLKKLLRQRIVDATISESFDVTSTIHKIDSTSPQVLILDIQMPGGSGLDVLSHISEAPNNILVMVLTNHSTNYYRDRCLSAGADHFFDKSEEFMKVIELCSSLHI